jgi:N-acetylglucosamine-6-phosphate deacetylase
MQNPTNNLTSLKIPGFIDLQVNGYMGVDFSSSDLTEKGFLSACKELVKAGTVGFLPTIITSPTTVYKRNLQLITQVIKNSEISSSVLGIHLEGPFISRQEGVVGAHNPLWVQQPDKALLDKLYKWSDENIKLLTIAAEAEGAEDLCRHATKLGITISLGHQLGTETDLQKLANAGARSLTHLGNGIPHLLPRHDNPLWSGIANDELIAMIIADGHHLPPSIIKTIIRTKGISNTIVVSDASPIAGLPQGRYTTLGNEVLLEESGYLHNPETGYLVGSSSTMLDCMNFLSSLELLSIEDLLKVGFYNPLKLINADPKTNGEMDLKYDETVKEFSIGNY